MTAPADVDSFWDLGAYLIVGLPGVIGAVLAGYAAMRNGKATKELQATTSEVRDQVANSHTINLRDDLDGKHLDTAAAFDRIERRLEIVGEQVNLTREEAIETRRDVRSVEIRVGRLEGRTDNL
ncbi:membrane protein [Gordonia phage ObLaDi]|uniref:Membrane protein n=3 Tax=Cafassovirus TaxID=3425056 RepID=A0A9E7TYA6_9CAUD|nr:membrane protein [Gordonia phage Cafasso]UVK59771.1 membrane protein [Gordonia phage Aleemily]UXE03755.1 membrane protein [Gordonia phage ObLaDi]